MLNTEPPLNACLVLFVSLNFSASTERSMANKTKTTWVLFVNLTKNTWIWIHKGNKLLGFTFGSKLFGTIWATHTQKKFLKVRYNSNHLIVAYFIKNHNSCSPLLLFFYYYFHACFKVFCFFWHLCILLCKAVSVNLSIKVTVKLKLI